ncbi:adenine nucleotide alpha hydrolases-like protein [Colletotrichum sublineola]|nr:adenine nucleotide alpha hydrolases-like protein [Colletotrichum sublineola]
MCGASVIVSLHRENPDPAAQAAEAVNKKDRLAKSLDLIKHRGPDARGILVDPTATVELSHTLFKGVNRIEPGYYAKVTRDGAISHAKYWEIELPDKTKVDNRSMDEMVEQLREQLVEAVRLRLRADVPIGIYLSGGLDSSMVAGIAKHLVDKEGVAMGSGSEPITTLSIAVNSDQENSVFDESNIASRTAEYLGVRNIKLKADEELLSSYFEEAI